MATEITPVALEALAELESKATPGPWRARAHRDASMPYPHLNLIVGIPENSPGWKHHEDAALTAALRNAAPALLAAARRLTELESAMEFLNGDGWHMPSDVIRAARERGWKSPVGQ